MNTATENLIRKIRALRAKADDPSVTEAEAALYAAKVAELVQQHGLSESALDEDETPEEIVEERWSGDYLTDKWRRMICNQAAALYFCQGFSSDVRASGKARRQHVFVGKAHNVIIARDMAEYLISTTVRLGKQYRDARFSKHDPKKSHAEFSDFLKGCGVRLAERLHELKQQQTAAAPARAANGNPANLPALYEDENRAITEFLKTKGLEDMRKGAIRVSTPGAAAGRSAAESVGLSAQIAGSRRGNLLR